MLVNDLENEFFEQNFVDVKLRAPEEFVDICKLCNLVVKHQRFLGTTFQNASNWSCRIVQGVDLQPR